MNKLVTNAFKEEPKMQQLFLIYESREIVGATDLLQGMKPCTFFIFNFKSCFPVHQISLSW